MVLIGVAIDASRSLWCLKGEHVDSDILAITVRWSRCKCHPHGNFRGTAMYTGRSFRVGESCILLG
ncbi:hypothetical protein BDW66DRAFT_134407 [Aspergillus desertorum]